jgi:GntR family transcriptional regulator
MASAIKPPRPPFEFQLNGETGVPVYRQIMDQVSTGLATGALRVGDQLPTVRQLAVDLAINPNTVIRAYRELEIRGLLESQQGTGTFISQQASGEDRAAQQYRLPQLVNEFVARAGAQGFTIVDLIEQLRRLQIDQSKKERGPKS